VNLTNYSSVKVLQTLNTRNDVKKQLPLLLGAIIALTANESASLRKSAVKCLAQIIDADPNLMFHSDVSRAVGKGFTDSAKSVREAAVTLVGQYVLKSPAITNLYHDSLIACLDDKGVSVRKAVVKIFRDVLLSQPNYERRAETCSLLVKMNGDIKEENSIKDLVR